jgi:hypothetical protein
LRRRDDVQSGADNLGDAGAASALRFFQQLARYLHLILRDLPSHLCKDHVHHEHSTRYFHRALLKSIRRKQMIEIDESILTKHHRYFCCESAFQRLAVLPKPR